VPECRKCGKCCYFKARIGGQVVLTKTACPFLDEKTNLCKVFDKRFEVVEGCLPAETAAQRGMLPEDCPFVQDIPNYKGPRPIEELFDGMAGNSTQ